MGVRVGLGVMGVLGLLLASSAGAAPQQKAAAQTGPATTVSPLTVAPAPIPEVGKGAPLYTSEELQTATKEEHRQSVQALQNNCLGGHVKMPQGYPDGISFGIFSYGVYESGKLASFLADKAAKATEAAAAARAEAAADPSKAQAAADAELVRQDAVNAYVAARKTEAEWNADIEVLAGVLDEGRSDLDLARAQQDADQARQATSQASSGTPVRRSNSFTAALAELRTRASGEVYAQRAERAAKGGAEVSDETALKDLSLVNVATLSKTDGKGAFVLVTGQIHNAAAKAVSIPALSVDAVDQGGRRLTGFVADPDRKKTIPPGTNIAFSYTFRPSPQRAVAYSVGFAGEQGFSMYSDAEFCGAR